MNGFEREALDRLPLAEAVLHLWGHVTNPDCLQAIFDTYRGQSYHKELSFATLVQLIADALLEHQGSGHKAMQRAVENLQLEASIRAAYAKLGRIPISLSNGFLLEGTLRLMEVLPAARPLAPSSLRGFIRLAIDGKKLKHLMKRLKLTRGLKGSVLGGKVAVALNLETGLAIAMSADPDGEVSDAPLMPDLLRQIRKTVAGSRLFVLDRQFCDLVQPAQLTTHGDHFLIRYNAKVSFHVDPETPLRTGQDERGRDYIEEWGWLGAVNDKRRCYVRRITLKRPGEEDVILITDLLDAETYPAVDLLATYLERWSIESMFQKITEVFHLNKLISSSPEGTIFQCSFCLLLYNMIEVLRGHLSEATSMPVIEVSMENLFDDVKRQMIAWTELVGPQKTAEEFEVAPSAEILRGRLKELLADLWKPRWKKAPAKKVQPPPNRVETPGGHTSVHRLRLQAKQAKITPVDEPAKPDA
jgi:Transposase DDE domain